MHVVFESCIGLADWCFADDILITKDGYENLTTAPKDIDEMKKIIDS